MKINNLLRKVKWLFQRFFRGYSDSDLLHLNSFIINKVRAPFKEFVKHQAEEGMALPEEFQRDPAMWLDILQKIELSLDDYWRSEHESDFDPIRGMGIEEINNYRKRVDEGFELFGRHLRSLWD